MAKLGSYFGLCPLVEQQNLLGISEASESGHVVITLSKNIAVKYRISDQKQVQSWRTKDKLSSPVVYDRETKKYAGAFNFVNLKVWDDDEEHLDKLKKYKYEKFIYTLLDVEGRPFVVFKNGNIFQLSDCIENRKQVSFETVFENDREEIEDVIFVAQEEKVYFGIVTKFEENLFLYLIAISNGNQRETISDKIELSRTGANLSGYVLAPVYDKSIHFLSLWSDSKLYSLQITGQICKPAEPFGDTYSTIESVSSTQFVAITTINNDNLVIYGADPNQEGAKLIVYNTQFKISQSQESFKLFSKAKKIWRVENYLFMCSGQNLAVVPFYFNTERLSALVGSHKIDLTDNDVQQSFEIVDWKSQKQIDFEYKVPKGIKKPVEEFLSQGLPEIAISDHVISLSIEENNFDHINDCLKYFKDISEQSIVKLLIYFLQIDANTLDYDSNKYKMVDKILSLSVSEALIMPHLRRNLDITLTLSLIQYITYLLSLEGHKLPNCDNVRTEGKLIEWGCMVLDASYQKLLLTQDSSVGEILGSFREIVREHLDCMKEIKSALPWCENIVKERATNLVNHSQSEYSVKEVKMF